MCRRRGRLRRRRGPPAKGGSSPLSSRRARRRRRDRTRRLPGPPRTLLGLCGSGCPSCCTRSPCAGPAPPGCTWRSGRSGLSSPPSRDQGPAPRVWRAWRIRCPRTSCSLLEAAVGPFEVLLCSARVGEHPVVVECLGNVVAPGIWEQNDDHGVLGQSLRRTDRPDGGHPARAPDEEALFGHQAAGHEERFPVVYLDHLVHHGWVVVTGVEVLSHALDGVLVYVVGVGEYRSFGVDTDDPDPGALLFQVAARSRDGSASAHPSDEMCDAAFGLAPDLGSRRLVVGKRIGRVLVLAWLEAARNLLCQPLCDGVVALGVIGRRSRRDDYLGAHSLQQVLFLFAHLIWHHADAPVAPNRGGQGQTGPRVPARRLDDGPAGPQESLLLGDLEHLDGRPVLYRAGGVQVLDLREEGGLYALVTFYSAHTDQGRVPDRREHVLEIVHSGRLTSPAPPNAFAYNPRPWKRVYGATNASPAKWNSPYAAPGKVQTP